jgi:hypothetical protein
MNRRCVSVQTHMVDLKVSVVVPELATVTWQCRRLSMTEQE